jgi:uncharacterized protein (DUF2252 family)
MSTAQGTKKTPLTHAERVAKGKALRQHVSRSSHAHWEPAHDRPDPIDMLVSSSQGRVPELIPIRYGRMLPSPFTFLRGSAAAMAFDLAKTPATGIHVQMCGDCHLMNFGGCGTPERNFIFDLMDFDESLPGPWEWDIKRLAASVVAAGRAIGLSERDCRDATLACVRSYRERISEFAAMHALDLWYAHIDGQALVKLMTSAESRRPGGQPTAGVIAHKIEHLFPKITEVVNGRRRFHDNPPLIFHEPHEGRFEEQVRHFLVRYRDTLPDDRRMLLDRYHVVDLAMKVVGIGSVGTRCAVLLLMAGDDDSLILQYKEADPSVLEPFAGKSKYKNHGQRVVAGQRLLQSASDLFLGWSSDDQGRDFYFRQLRDMKTTVRVDGMSASVLAQYAAMCGWALARGHAKSGDAALVSGYLGRGEAFDRALASFARTYADQTERDHAAMVQAVKAGRLVAQTDAQQAVWKK